MPLGVVFKDEGFPVTGAEEDFRSCLLLFMKFLPLTGFLPVFRPFDESLDTVWEFLSDFEV